MSGGSKFAPESTTIVVDTEIGASIQDQFESMSLPSFQNPELLAAMDGLVYQYHEGGGTSVMTQPYPSESLETATEPYAVRAGGWVVYAGAGINDVVDVGIEKPIVGKRTEQDQSVPGRGAQSVGTEQAIVVSSSQCLVIGPDGIPVGKLAVDGNQAQVRTHSSVANDAAVAKSVSSFSVLAA